MPGKIAVIIGAGPAGLTAAYELTQRSDITPLVFDLDSQVGGISKTVEYRGNRMDIGGHRFFSKSDWVMQWWQSILPVRAEASGEAVEISYQNQTTQVRPQGADHGECMLVRPRLSRIYYLRRFFDYPIKLNTTTIRNLGPWRLVKILLSYVRARVWSTKPELSLEDFIINRFGRELYLTFFKDYTEKVWGVPCHAISAEWGAQRIKGLSLTAALRHALSRLRHPGSAGVAQKTVETSLIERFLYPRLGPGQMWETVAQRVIASGGSIELGWRASGIHHDGQGVQQVVFTNAQGDTRTVAADYVISTMPVRDLIASLQPAAPEPVRAVASGLIYRDFITVGVLVRHLRQGAQPAKLLDNWIYVQEKDVRLGRLQIFNNWSPDLVADVNHTVWLGLEYFCDDTDDLWRLSNADMAALAIKELAQIALIDPDDVLDTHVVKVPKAYPAYFGSYDRFDTIRRYVDGFDNLYLVGRNGMHRYNNQDHSMLTAKLAVDAIVDGVVTRDQIWTVNTEGDYHEQKSAN